jgi:hypothetical protein
LRGKIIAIEKPVRDKLIAEKVEFHVRLAESSHALEGKTVEQFREETLKRFTRDVNLQPKKSILCSLRSRSVSARKFRPKSIRSTRLAPSLCRR